MDILSLFIYETLHVQKQLLKIANVPEELFEREKISRNMFVK